MYIYINKTLYTCISELKLMQYRMKTYIYIYIYIYICMFPRHTHVFLGYVHGFPTSAGAAGPLAKANTFMFQVSWELQKITQRQSYTYIRSSPENHTTPKLHIYIYIHIYIYKHTIYKFMYAHF